MIFIQLNIKNPSKNRKEIKNGKYDFATRIALDISITIIGKSIKNRLMKYSKLKKESCKKILILR